jgi:hypothetical protein
MSLVNILVRPTKGAVAGVALSRRCLCSVRLRPSRHLAWPLEAPGAQPPVRSMALTTRARRRNRASAAAAGVLQS